MRFFKLIVGLHNFLKEHRNNIKKINHGNDPMLERTIQYSGTRNLDLNRMVIKVWVIKLIKK